MHLTVDTAGVMWTADDCMYGTDTCDDLRKECFDSVHSHPFSGHYGDLRTLKKDQKLFYWPAMAKDLKHWTKACDSCQRIKARKTAPPGKLQPLEIPGRRWESVSMDFVTGLPNTPQGNDSIWVVVDRLTKLIHLEPCKKSITAEETAMLYQKAVFKHHGVPQSIVSDRDVKFVSGFWRSVNKLMATKMKMSTKYHPQTDGQTENANGVMKDTLRHFVGPYQQEWEELLPMVEFAMNNAYNSTIQTTPFMLTYGQDPDDPTVARLRHRNPNVNKFVGKWREQLVRAKYHIEAAQQRQKSSADKKRRDSPDYEPGDEVLLAAKYFRLLDTQTRKLALRWVDPFKILEPMGPYKLAYKLDLPQVVKHMHPVFHVSALRPYLRDGPYQPPPLPEFVDGGLEYVVAYISSTRYEGNRRQYRVHWEGSQDHDTWEPKSNLTNCADAIDDFWKFKGLNNPEAASTWTPWAHPT